MNLTANLTNSLISQSSMASGAPEKGWTEYETFISYLNNIYIPPPSQIIPRSLSLVGKAGLKEGFELFGIAEYQKVQKAFYHFMKTLPTKSDQAIEKANLSKVQGYKLLNAIEYLRSIPDGAFQRIADDLQEATSFFNGNLNNLMSDAIGQIVEHLTAALAPQNPYLLELIDKTIVSEFSKITTSKSTGNVYSTTEAYSGTERTGHLQAKDGIRGPIEFGAKQSKQAGGSFYFDPTQTGKSGKRASDVKIYATNTQDGIRVDFDISAKAALSINKKMEINFANLKVGRLLSTVFSNSYYGYAFYRLLTRVSSASMPELRSFLELVNFYQIYINAGSTDAVTDFVINGKLYSAEYVLTRIYNELKSGQTPHLTFTNPRVFGYNAKKAISTWVRNTRIPTLNAITSKVNVILPSDL